MKHMRWLIVFLTFAFLAPTLFAQPPQRGQRPGNQEPGQGMTRRALPPFMTALDQNKDGTLSAEEISAASTALMKLDKNKDGKLDATELMPAPRSGRPPSGNTAGGASNTDAFVGRLMERDKNKDGKISKEEAGEQMSRFFGSMDSNKDGYLDQEEMVATAKRFSSQQRYQRPQPKSKDHRPPFDDN